MIDPLLDTFEGQKLSPKEINDTLLSFLGHTYKEVSKFDSNLVSPNPFLAPKKQEFQNIASKVMQETQMMLGPNTNPQRHTVPQNVVTPNNSVNNSSDEIVVQQQYDPNQMEFSFDNSVTAKTINNKLEDLEKRIKSIDSTLHKVLSLLEQYDSENSQ
jgi:hypothetical protein